MNPLCIRLVNWMPLFMRGRRKLKASINHYSFLQGNKWTLLIDFLLCLLFGAFIYDFLIANTSNLHYSKFLSGNYYCHILMWGNLSTYHANFHKFITKIVNFVNWKTRINSYRHHQPFIIHINSFFYISKSSSSQVGHHITSEQLSCLSSPPSSSIATRTCIQLPGLGST